MKAKEELKELKTKSQGELQRLLALYREKLRELRFRVSQNQLKNLREIRQLRKKISQILTILNQAKKDKPSSSAEALDDKKEEDKKVKNNK